MKALLLLLACALAGCVTPVVNTYSNPPGIFLGLPAIPVEVGAQLRQPREVRQARAAHGRELDALTRGLVNGQAPSPEGHPGLKRALSR